MTDPANLTVTAPIPYKHLVAVVRGGFAEEAARKVNALPMVMHRPGEVLVNLNDVLDLLERYR